MPHDDIPNMFGRGLEATLLTKFLYVYDVIKLFCTCAKKWPLCIDKYMNIS